MLLHAGRSFWVGIVLHVFIGRSGVQVCKAAAVLKMAGTLPHEMDYGAFSFAARI